jgi:hypothetical protein
MRNIKLNVVVTPTKSTFKAGTETHMHLISGELEIKQSDRIFESDNDLVNTAGVDYIKNSNDNKIVASTDPSLNLPTISTDFIRYFNMANSINDIGDVTCSEDMKVNLDGTIMLSVTKKELIG